MSKAKTISKILKLKDSKKKELELEVKKASDRVEKEKSKLQNLEKNYKDTLKLFNKKQAEGSIDISSINSYYDFFSRINGEINEQRKIHSRRKNELKSLKNTLVNAHKDKKMFEILNDKVIRRELKEKEISEQKEADFFALSRKLK